MDLESEETAERDEFFEECLNDPTLRDQMSILTRKFRNKTQVVIERGKQTSEKMRVSCTLPECFFYSEVFYYKFFIFHLIRAQALYIISFLLTFSKAGIFCKTPGGS